MSPELAHTPLYDWHASHQARIVDFAGWAMPVQYSSIVDEHRTTRQAVGLFDISHMGRLRFEGPDAAKVLDRLLTRRASALGPGKIRYALVTNEQGGILDDVLVYRLEQQGAPFFLLVVNASNREKIVNWIRSQLPADAQVKWSDQTRDTGMIAVQGPRAVALTQACLSVAVEQLEYYTGQVATVLGHESIVSRTGYTGEDGCELIVPAEAARPVWERLLSAGQSWGAAPCGLGARDTLRLEAAMPLYGHELSEDINPFQAELAFAVQFKDHDFVGREALLKCRTDSPAARRVGLEMSGKRVPREHYTVWQKDQQVGQVTSGTFSPTLDKPIAMAYIQAEAAAVGTPLEVDIRGRREGARVVALPFYRRSGS